jgi:hypothetical protein
MSAAKDAIQRATRCNGSNRSPSSTQTPHGLATIAAAGDHGRSARPAGARPHPDVRTPAASRSNSLIPCSNSARSLIPANYLPVTAI